MMRSSQIWPWSAIQQIQRIRIARDTKLSTSSTLTEFSVFSLDTFSINACIFVLALKPRALTLIGSASCFSALILSEMLSSNGLTTARAYASSKIKI